MDNKKKHDDQVEGVRARRFRPDHDIADGQQELGSAAGRSSGSGLSDTQRKEGVALQNGRDVEEGIRASVNDATSRAPTPPLPRGDDAMEGIQEDPMEVEDETVDEDDMALGSMAEGLRVSKLVYARNIEELKSVIKQPRTSWSGKSVHEDK